MYREVLEKKKRKNAELLQRYIEAEGKILPRNQVKKQVVEEQIIAPAFVEEQTVRVENPLASVEQNVEQNVEPSVEPTVEQNVEPTVEPPVEPTVEQNVEQNVEPSVEPTVEPPVARVEEQPPVAIKTQEIEFSPALSSDSVDVNNSIKAYPAQPTMPGLVPELKLNNEPLKMQLNIPRESVRTNKLKKISFN